MGLFRKKKKEEPKIENNNSIQTTSNIENTNNNVQIEPNNIGNVEVLNLNPKNEKIDTSIEKKKDLRFLIILFGIVIIFVLLLPTLRGILIPKPKIILNPSTNEEKEFGNLEHGYLVIGKNSYKTVKDIKFLDFKKYENNNLVFSYISDKNLKNVKDFNIYIKVIDELGTFLHMEKFNIDTINMNSKKSYSMNLNYNIFKNSHYVKVEENEVKNKKETMICKDEEDNKITYYFNDKLLTSYTFTGINNDYKEEYELLKKTNIKPKDINYDEESLYYKIDFSYFESDEKDITRYNLNDHYDGIKKYEIEKGWTCE